MARGTSRRGFRYSADSDESASQPAKPQTRIAAAAPSPAQPCGANGVRFANLRCGSAASTVTTSSRARVPVSTSCTRPEMRRPKRFMTYAVSTTPRNVSSSVVRPPPSASATYPPVNDVATGAPSGTAKKKHHPTAADARRPKAMPAYVATPPPSGKRAPSAANVQASGAERRIRASHASSAAGPAAAAASAGMEMSPVPSTAPIDSAVP
ncbi:hypothetical protein L3i22_017490 [Actinoplanes sp. L3-i22]|nr:hypothetical protein L3i22_017490 [Actinoplanes sp. L3-i22]